LAHTFAKDILFCVIISYLFILISSVSFDFFFVIWFRKIWPYVYWSCVWALVSSRLWQLRYTSVTARYIWMRIWKWSRKINYELLCKLWKVNIFFNSTDCVLDNSSNIEIMMLFQLSSVFYFLWRMFLCWADVMSYTGVFLGVSAPSNRDNEGKNRLPIGENLWKN